MAHASLRTSRTRTGAQVAAIGAALAVGFVTFAAMARPSAPEPWMRGVCDLPPRRCTGSAASCAELVRFFPPDGPGYTLDTEASATHLRRDLMVRVQYAAARVACDARDLRTGNGGDVAFLDMSEDDGDIPGSASGHPGHPYGSHTGGRDLDIAYYQTGTRDNRWRPVCPSVVDGVDHGHCTGAPARLDAARTALFIGVLFEEPGIRVVGVDGRIAPELRAALRELVGRGKLSVEAAAAATRHLASESEDTGLGWYLSHHHHFHVSLAVPVVVDAP